MKIKTAEFVTSAPNLAACPRVALPEFAFIGRSNVGKSSLVNMITGRNNLAKVSATPGKTDLLNFFAINGAWHLVDLPGYGFAKTSRDKRDRFGTAVDDYIEGRLNLCHVFVLIDSRLPPQPIDLQFILWLQELDRPYTVVFTKADKQSASQTGNNVKVVLAEIERLTRELPPHVISSSKTQDGRSAILGKIDQLCAETKKR